MPKPRGRFFLNTFSPIVASAFGREASVIHDLPPFIDGSIRREPDLEHRFPGISGLCRTDRFAPRLLAGDTVGYMTKKGRYGDVGFPHRRLAAVLRVLKRCESHKEAAAWYERKRRRLPSNCMVPGNRPFPLKMTHMKESGHSGGCASVLQQWDAEYRARARAYPVYVICKVIFRDLSWNARVVEDDHLLDAFGTIPGTQTPGVLDPSGFRRLMRSLRITLPPSAR